MGIDTRQEFRGHYEITESLCDFRYEITESLDDLRYEPNDDFDVGNALIVDS